MSVTPQILKDESTFAVLRSLNNEGTYANNSDIVHQMKPPLKFQRDGYEIGLRKLTYYPNNRPKDGASVPTNKTRKTRKRRTVKLDFHERPVPPGPLFPGYKPPKVISEISFAKKEGETLQSFLKRFNDEISPTYKVSLLQQYVGPRAEAMVITLDYANDDANRVLLISESFAKLIGHYRIQFFSGKYVGSEVITQKNFDAVSVNDGLNLNIISYPYKDSLFEIKQQFDALFAYAKLERHYKPFFQNISLDLTRACYAINFSFTSDNKCIMEVKGTPAPPDGENYVIIDKDIVDCLGFTTDRFNVGTHRSEVPFSLSKFTAIPPQKILFFRFRVYLPLFLLMPEPKNLSIKYILSTLNQTCGTQRYDDYLTKFYCSYGDLVLNSVPDHVRITLPDPLYTYLGIPKKTVFQANSRMSLTKEIVQEEEEIEYLEEDADYITPKAGEARKLLILSDLVREQVYGSRLVNLLQEINLSYDTNKECEITFNPVLYLPLSTQQVNQARIRFVDEFLRPLRFDNKDTSVTLEFRPKQ